MRIFISYRRGSTTDITGRIHDRLETHFGADAIFQDVDNIPPGVWFPDHLEEALEGCELVLAIIGPDWVTPRLDEPQDFLRQELEFALSKSIPLIPVLVGGARVPSETSLPPSLVALCKIQAAKVSSEGEFSSNMSFLIRSIERLPELAQRRQQKLQERQQAEEAQRRQAEELERLRIEAAKRREAEELERLRTEALKSLAAEKQEQLRLEAEQRNHAEERTRLLAEEQELRQAIEEERQRVAALKQQQAEERTRREAEEKQREQEEHERVRTEALKQQQANESARKLAEQARLAAAERERERMETKRRVAEEQNRRRAEEKRQQEAREQERQAALARQPADEQVPQPAKAQQQAPRANKRPGIEFRSPPKVDEQGHSIEPQLTSVPALPSERKGTFSGTRTGLTVGVLVLGAIVAAFMQWSPADPARQAAASASASVAAAPAAPAPVPCPTGMAAIAGTDRVTTFCMDRTEVAVEDFSKCVQAGSCSQPGTDEGCTWKDKDKLARHPINCVAQDDARRYCAFTKKTLPTLNQWQVAAAGAGAVKRRFPWGDEIPSAVLVNARGSEAKNDDLGSLYAGNDGYEATAPVDTFPRGATPERVLQLAGNVFEWLSEASVAIGGCFGTAREEMLKANPLTPWRNADKPMITIGFRCVREPNATNP